MHNNRADIHTYIHTYLYISESVFCFDENIYYPADLIIQSIAESILVVEHCSVHNKQKKYMYNQ